MFAKAFSITMGLIAAVVTVYLAVAVLLWLLWSHS
jgi:hypothetical protein